MAPSVRLSEQTARTALAWSPEDVPHPRDIAARRELRLALAPKREPSRKRAERRPILDALGPTKKELARARRQDIRTAVFLRAGGVCECGCGEMMFESASKYSETRGELDHFFGRSRGRLAESEQTCWALRADCHRRKTLNRPDAAAWFRKFMEHCRKYGFRFEAARQAAGARLRFVETRSNLPASPRTR